MPDCRRTTIHLNRCTKTLPDKREMAKRAILELTEEQAELLLKLLQEDTLQAVS